MLKYSKITVWFGRKIKDFILITFLDFGTDDWFSDQFDDLVFGEIDELTRDDDLVNKQASYASDGLDGNQFENFG